jgi:hypothetical protein
MAKRIAKVPRGFLLVCDGVGVFSVRRVETFSNLLDEVRDFFLGLGLDEADVVKALGDLRESAELSLRPKVRTACRVFESSIDDGSEVQLLTVDEAISGRGGAKLRARYREDLVSQVQAIEDDAIKTDRLVGALETLSEMKIGPTEIEPFLEWIDSEASG